MLNILIIQENGRHDGNRVYRECFCLQRACRYHNINADVWGLGHNNFNQTPDWESYDLILNIENYDETGWVPSLSSVKTKKFLWSIDAHVKGLQSYLDTFENGKYDLILQSTPEFILDNRSVWFPNAYDDDLIHPLNIEKNIDIGFCGNINNRGGLLQLIPNIKLDTMVIGNEMVKAINSYKVHFNANISIDINYRNFETIGCGTCLLTSYNKHYEKLGFKHGHNCLIYSNVQEMLDNIQMLLNNQDLRFKIEEHALELASFHTYKQRVNIIKELI
jgi:spore maturation protein CgeB